MTDIIILKGKGQYKAIEYFSEKLHAAFNNEKIQCNIVDLSEVPPKDAMNIILDSKPKLCISFNAIGFSVNGVPYYKYLGVNLLALLVDHPIYHTPHLDLSYERLFIASVDIDRVNYIRNELKVGNSFLLYHGVDKDISSQFVNKDIDCVFLGSIIDYEKLRRQWKQKYNDTVNHLLDGAIEIGMYNSFISTDKMLDIAMEYYKVNISDKDKLEFSKALIPEIDGYLRAFHRCEVINKFKKTKITVYGNGPWENYIKGNVRVMSAVDMEEGIKIMQNSKVTLNCTMTTFYNGSHERPLMAAMAGSVVASNHTPFFEETFGKNAILKNIIDMQDFDDELQDVIGNNELRIEMAKAARKSISEKHTWNNRVLEIKRILGL